MSFLSLCSRLLLASLGVSFCWSGVMAQAPSSDLIEELEASIEAGEVVEIQTSTRVAATIDFIGPIQDNVARGILSLPTPMRNISHIEVKVIQPGGAVAHTAKLDAGGRWGDVLSNYKFGIELQDIGIQEGARLQMELFQGGKAVAFAERELPEQGKRPEFLVDNYKVSVADDLVKLSYRFVNSSLLPQRVVPQVTFTNQNIKKGAVVLQKFMDGQVVGAKSEVSFEHELTVPNQPGTYEAVIWLLDENRALVTGALRQVFVVEGDYGVFQSVRLVEAETEDFLMVKGVVSPSVDGDLSLALTAAPLQAGERGKALSKTVPVTVKPGQTFEVRVPVDAAAAMNGRLVGKAQLLLYGGVVSETEFSFMVTSKPQPVVTPKSDLKDAEDEKKEPLPLGPPTDKGGKWWLWGLLLLGITLGALGGRWWLRLKNKPRLMALLLLMFVGSVSAQSVTLLNTWYYPQDGWIYNPTAIGSYANFRYVRFDGSVFNPLTQQGFFQVDPEAIMVRFVNAGDYRYSQAFTFSISDHKRYQFDIPAPTDLSENGWALELYFKYEGSWYVSAWQDEVTSNNYLIGIDKTRPVLQEFFYDGTTYIPSEQLLRPGLEVVEGEETVLLQQRKAHFLDRKANQIQRDLIRSQRKLKIKQRNALVNALAQEELAQKNQQAGAAVVADPAAIVTQLNQTTSALNALTRTLGEAVSGSQLFQTSSLDNNSVLDPVDITPSTNPIFNCAKDVASTNATTTRSTYAGCVDYFQTAIDTLNPQISAKRAQLRTAKTRFKNQSIGVNFTCEDTGAGCNPACNAADDQCNIDCELYPLSCNSYQVQNPVGYTANCSGSPVTCSVDCTVDSNICQMRPLLAEVRGNFCDDDVFCDVTATRKFQACDNVGNCVDLSNQAVETDWYDPVKPNVAGMTITRNKGNIGGTETALPLETTTGGVIVTNCATLPSGFAGGIGSVGNPYQICNFQQLDNVRNDVTANYVLISNIDISATATQNAGAGWTPIVNFSGTFDGQGFVLKGLFINRPLVNDQGLFARLVGSGKVQNLGVIAVDITGKDNVGGVVGYWNNANITGAINNVYVKGSVTGVNQVGGVIGRWTNNGANLTNTHSEVTLTATGNNAGGVMGQFEDLTVDDNGNIQRVYANGSVNGGTSVGGLIGQAVINTLDLNGLNEAYAIGGVAGNANVGGIIGSVTLNGSSAIIKDTYYAGTLFSNGTVAGIANGTAGIENSYFLQTDTLNIGVTADGGAGASLVNVYPFTDSLLKAQSSSAEPLQPYYNWPVVEWNFGTVNRYPELIDSVEYNETIAGNSGQLAANDRFSFKIDAADAFNPDASTNPDLFDINACGSASNTGFFLAEDGDPACSQRNTACALSSTLRGVKDNLLGTACGVACPTVSYNIDGQLITETYERQGDLCVPRCDYRLFDGCFPFLLIGETCENVSWLPLETSIDEGTVFTQTSNCGDTRNWVGTKPISQSIKHFLDGKNVFGVYFYDTFDDGPGFTDIAFRAEFNVDQEGFTQEHSGTATALWKVEEGYSPNGGKVLKIESNALSGGYAAWQKTGIPVSANTDYILTYWVKTNATTNRNGSGAWPALYENGTTALHPQYQSTMTSVANDLSWQKVEIPFTTGASATTVEVQMRLEAQDNTLAYFDDIVIMKKNWRFDASKSWYSETKGDAIDGICDYTTGDGDGDPRLGTDVRCGKDYFPEKSVVAFTSDGIWLLDAIDGVMWMSALADPGGGWRYVFSTLLSGTPFASNGKIISGFRFAQGGGRNGAVTIGDFVNDTMYSHRMSNCFTLAGYKGIGSSSSNYGCTWWTQWARNWNGFVNDVLTQRNVNRNPWSNVMPPNISLANHQINAVHSNIVGGKEYVVVGHDFAGITILNKTDNTVQYIEFDGDKHNDPGYPAWDNLPSTANDYRAVYLTDTGRLFYLWDYYQDSKTRLHVIDDITTLPFNGSILSGNATFDQRIQPNSASSSYPTTALNGSAAALDVKDDRVLIGGDTGFNLFKGQLTGGSQHPDLSKQRVLRSFASAPLFGNVMGHWVNGVTDVSGKANNLTNQNGVNVSLTNLDSDLQQFNFNNSAYLKSGPGDYSFANTVTFGTWVFTDPNVDDGGYIIAQKDVVDTEYALYRTADNKLRVEGATTHTVDGYTLDGWNFVVASFDGTTKRAYIDGVKVLEVPDVIGSASGGATLDPSNITYLNEYDNNSGANSIDQTTAVEVVGNYAYVTARNAGALQIFDVSNPSNIQHVGGYKNTTLLDRAYDVKIQGNYAYVTNQRRDSLAVIDISNPSNPQYVTEERSSSNLNGAIALDIQGNYAYVASLNDDSVSAVDISNPNNPVLLNQFDDPRIDAPYDVEVDGSYAYVAAGNANALVILDLSDPTTPTYVGQYQNNTFMSGARDVKVVGNYAFVANYNRRSMAVIDITNKANPTFVTEVRNTSRLNGARHITIDGNYAYIAAYRDDSLQMIDISTPTNPTLVGEYPTSPSLNGIIDVAVVGDKIFTANYVDDSLTALNIGQTVSALSMKIGAGEDGGDSTTLFNGAMALPFIAEGPYSDQNVRDVYNGTRDWFKAGVKITLQGTSDQVVDVKFGDYGSYFVATNGGGITQFDFSGRVVRTISASAPSDTNVHIVSNNINAMDYRNGWLIIAYQGRGVEIVNIAPKVSEMLSLYDDAAFDPFFFY